MMAADLVGRASVCAVREPDSRGTRGQGGDGHHSNRIRDWQRSRRHRAGRQPQPARRECYRGNFPSVALGAKRLELLRDLVPKIASMGFAGESEQSECRSADQERRAGGGFRRWDSQLNVLNASHRKRFRRCLCERLSKQRTAAVLVSADAFFISRIESARRTRGSLIRFPPSTLRASSLWRAVLSAMEASFIEHYRQAATYVGRILKGEKASRSAGHAADEIRASHQSQDRQGARPEVPPKLLALADEVIE